MLLNGLQIDALNFRPTNRNQACQWQSFHLTWLKRPRMPSCSARERLLSRRILFWCSLASALASRLLCFWLWPREPAGGNPLQRTSALLVGCRTHNRRPGSCGRYYRSPEGERDFEKGDTERGRGVGTYFVQGTRQPQMQPISFIPKQ